MPSSVALLFVVIFGFHYTNSAQNPDLNLFTSTFHAYDRLLQFLEIRNDKLNLDSVFAVILAEVFLNEATQFPLPKNWLNSIKILLNRTVQLRRSGQEYLFNHYENLNDPLLKIVDIRKWLKNNSFQKGDLTLLKPKWEENYLNFTVNDERKSDSCIRGILQGNTELKRMCPVIPQCGKKYCPFDIQHGYTISHILLFWQIYERYNCVNNNNVQILKSCLCSKMLQETTGIANLSEFPPYIYDIFLENVVLCGSEGYEEFLENPRWIEIVLSWQNENGCYRTLFPLAINRQKRTTADMGQGCDNHTNGLALACLSLYMKYLLYKNIL